MFKKLFARHKLPAWTVLLFVSLWKLADIGGRIGFCLDAAKFAWGHHAMAITIVASPWFSLGLVVLSIGYLAFVGEPEQGVQRHPWWPYIGWSFFLACFSLIVTITLYGYFHILVSREVGKEDIKIQQQALAGRVFWHLTDFQKEKLGAALDQTPTAERFEIKFKCQLDTNSRTYTDDLSAVFDTHNWKVSGNCFNNLKAGLTGLYIVASQEVAHNPSLLSPKVKILGDMLTAADIKWDFAEDDEIKDNNDFALAIGVGPNE